MFYCRYWRTWLVMYRLTLAWLLHTEAQHYFFILLHTSGVLAGRYPRKMWLHFLSDILTGIFVCGLGCQLFQCVFLLTLSAQQCSSVTCFSQLIVCTCVKSELLTITHPKIENLLSVFHCFTWMSFPSPFWPVFLLPRLVFLSSYHFPLCHFFFLLFYTLNLDISVFLSWHVLSSSAFCHLLSVTFDSDISLHFCLASPPFPSVALCRVWEVTTGEVLNTLIHHNEAVLHLRFANGLMVTCSKDRSIAVWDMASPTDISLRRVLVGHRAAVNVVDFDDKYIVSASGDRTIKVRDISLSFFSFKY